ncbi:MAG: FHA domain-containing protein [Anaerolineales bacterium]|nr:FHA domain-containing protein [Anaerolineales bacterium]
MIRCPNCGHQEFVGTIFCSECGTRLVHLSSMPTIRVTRESIDREAVVTKPTTPEGPVLESGALLGLKEIKSGDILSLVGRNNYTLGRTKKNQAIMPDVDLTAYDAYDYGVSRIHAEIRLTSEGIYMIDLDSSNGTLVNGHFLEPQRPFPIRHGDILQLGRMRLQLITRLR